MHKTLTGRKPELEERVGNVKCTFRGVDFQMLDAKSQRVHRPKNRGVKGVFASERAGTRGLGL